MPTTIARRAAPDLAWPVALLAVTTVGWALQSVATVCYALDDAALPAVLPFGIAVVVASGAALLPDPRARAARLAGSWRRIAAASAVALAGVVATPILVAGGSVLGAMALALAGASATALSLAEPAPAK